MKKSLCAMLLLYTCHVYALQEADLNELLVLEEPMLAIDDQTRALCATLVDIYAQLEHRSDRNLPENLVIQVEDLSYAALLQAIQICLQATWPHDEQWRVLYHELLELYDELLQDYAIARDQPGMRNMQVDTTLNKHQTLAQELKITDRMPNQSLRINSLIAQQQTIMHNTQQHKERAH